MDNEVLKKSIETNSITTSQKLNYISNPLAAFGSIKRGCEAMKMPKNIYYYRLRELSIWEKKQ